VGPHFIALKNYRKMWNFIWLDIDSNLQTNDSKWLDSSCDSSLTQLDQVMTRSTRLAKFLDDSDAALTRRACDSDLTKMTRANHWRELIRDERTVKFFSPSPVLIKLNPILIRKIFENHQSDSVLIRQCKIMYFHFASWGKRTTGAILPLAKYDWLKAK